MRTGGTGEIVESARGLAHSKTWRSPGRRSERGVMLIDCLVYCVLFFVVTGAAFSFFSTCSDGSFALRKNADDIATALRTGEMWRADVREATGAIEVERSAEGEMVKIPEKSGDVVYKFAARMLSRSADGRERELLSNVNTSRMEPEKRQQVTAWRWEVELLVTKKHTLQVHPAFTFEAVPNKL
jgi:hypothetical protein